MKTNTFKNLALALTLGFSAFGGEEVTPLVLGEYTKIQNEFQASLSSSKKSMHTLQNDRKRVVTQYQQMARIENAGIEALKKYDLLLGSRYSNEKGEYQAGMELVQKDVENLNRIFENLIRMTPFTGRVSAGHARRIITWGTQYIEGLAKVHADPTEQNNPELEIIAKQLRDSELKIKTVTELAAKLGVKLNENIALDESNPSDRKPASVKEKENR